MTTLPCRSCGAPIGFIDMPSGRKMPVDPELVKTFLRPAAIGDPPMVLVTERGSIVRGAEVSFTVPGAESVEGYVPHWSTCTDPARHRTTPTRRT